jgi:hypothetical protein
MGAAALRAKLLIVRALSTILLVVLLAAPAGAQVYGAPRDYRADALWISGGTGTMRAVSVLDRASDATWVLDESKPVGGSVEWGRADRTIGVRVQQLTAAMQFEGASCIYCDGEVQALTALAVYRRASPLFNSSSLRQIVELGAGATRWSNLRGRNGHQLPTIAPVFDFTYSASIGIGLPLGERLEATAMYDVLMARHRLLQTSSPDSKSIGYIGFAVVRFGARWRLGE